MSKKLTGTLRVASILVFAMFIITSILFYSFESTINVKAQKLEMEISKLQGDVEGLTLEVQQASSFSKIQEIALKNGYIYRQTNSTATAVTTGE